MPKPIALCVERIDETNQRFISCVAALGREPGLSLDPTGEVLWQQTTGAELRLCVAQDGRLIALREPGAPEVTLTRDGRSLEVPAGKPVFVLDQDELVLGRPNSAGRVSARLRLHVHGTTEHTTAPQPVTPQGSQVGASRWLLAGAAALALGATAGGGLVSAAPSGPQSQPANAAATRPDAGPSSRPIEVRETPPAPVPEPRPPRTGCGGCSMVDLARVPADQDDEPKR